VFIVDDHADTCDLYQAALEADGFDVSCTTLGATAIEALRTANVAAVVVDADMPDMDGWTVIDRLKSDPRHAGLLVVMVTAHAFPGVEQRAIAAGCAAYFSKPLLPFDLSAALRRLLFPERAEA
jgi:CheY-like chemotaxis protein